MKIGFILDDSLDSTDGVQQYVLALGTWLGSQGHEVHYLVGQTTRTDLPHVHSLSRNITVRFNGNCMSMPLLASRHKIKKLLDAEQFDVLHVQMPFSPFMGAKVIKAAPANTRIIGTYHILPLGGLANLGAGLLALWTRPALRRINAVLSVSEPAQQFARSLGIQSTVLPNVIDVSRFGGAKSIKKYENNFTLVFLGRLVARKGCKQLLGAIKQWQDQYNHPDVRLLLAGDGSERPALERWVAANGLAKTVTFVGFVPELEKSNYLASANVAVFPSLGGESFGIVLLEAIASGAGVVVGGNNPGYASVLGRDSLAIFDPTNTTQFVDMLERLYGDKKLRAKLHAKQKTLLKQYNVAVVGKKLLSYYYETTHQA